MKKGRFKQFFTSENLADIVVNGRKAVIIITAAILFLAGLGIFYFIYDDRINSDMLEYLPENTSTAEGINFLKQHFGIKGDAFIVAEGEEDHKLLEQNMRRLKEIEGVRQFLWYGDLLELEEYSKNPYLSFLDIEADWEVLKDYLRRPLPNGKYNYVALMLFDYSPSTPQAFKILDTIYDEFEDGSVAVSGMTAIAKKVMEDTMREVVFYILFGVIAVSIVLFLTSSSYFEPVILIVTLLTAVIINMGFNLIYKSVSILSFASAGVLQLGITMDYAIFYMHIYKEQRQSLLPPEQAAKRALKKSAMPIFASSLTTIGGFLALCFMQFKIGIDLSKVVVKGILMSLATVAVLQPALAVTFDKLLQKSAQKTLRINIEKPAKGIIKWRRIIAAAAILMIIPAYIAQMNTKFSYLKIYQKHEAANEQQKLAEKLGNQIICAVPLKTKTLNHKSYMDEIAQNPKFSAILGAYSALDIEEERLEGILDLLIKDDECGIEELQAITMLFKKVDGEWHTLYLIEVDGDTEDAKAFVAHEHFDKVSRKYFDKHYPLGILTGVADMAKVTPQDFLRVTLVSGGIVFLVLAMFLKSFLKALTLVLVIDLAVWINISLNYIFGSSVNFMVYIIISSVQLGCTVDYAILLTAKYEEAKQASLDAQEAAARAITQAFPAISTSACIIIAVCLSVVFVTQNLIVKQIAQTLARGALVSYIMVITVLPCFLVWFKKRKKYLGNGDKLTSVKKIE